MNPNSQKYLYAVVETDQPIQIGTRGVDAEPVYNIVVGGLGCVVSDAHQEDYVADRATLAAHERVLEELSCQYTLLPMRFGSVAGTQKEVERFLKRHATKLRKAIQKLANKVEVEIEIFWKHLPTIFQEIANSSQTLKTMKASSKKHSREELIMAGQLVHSLLEKKKEKEIARYLKLLKSVSKDHVLNPCPADDLLMNGSFLVSRDLLQKFDQAVDKLEADNREGIRVRYIGPMPPYSFVNMRIA